MTTKLGAKDKATPPLERFPVGKCKGCGKELDGEFKELADGETIVFCSYECYCNDCGKGGRSSPYPAEAKKLWELLAAECTAPAPQPDWKKEALALVVLLRAKCSEEEWASMESRFAAECTAPAPTDTENLCYCGNPMNWSASSGCYYPHVGCKRKFEGTSEQASPTPEQFLLAVFPGANLDTLEISARLVAKWLGEKR